MKVIHLLRKPCSEPTVAANVLRWGTGALNIDATRVGFVSEADEAESKTKNQHADFGSAPKPFCARCPARGKSNGTRAEHTNFA